MTTALDNAIGLYMEGIRDGNPRIAVEKFIGDRYTQHSTGVPNGPEGFVAFFEDFLRRNPKRHIEVVRGWQDGRHVFLQAYQSLNDGEYEYVTTDFFDSDADGRIIEHWDVISLVTPSPSGHTQIDGPTEIEDLESTESNKALVRDMLRDCLFDGARGGNIGEYIGQDCIEHTLDLADGLASFAARVQAPGRQLDYRDIVLCVGRGNFVATLCKATLAGEPLCQVDLFRLADGRIVEHWDNSEPVPEHTVNAGKF